MATRTWNGSTTSWNTAGNWLEGSVPTSTDDVIFSDQSVQDCVCDVAIDVLSLTIQSTYSGTLDFANSSYSHTVGGDCIWDGSGTVDMGNCTLDIGGTFDYEDQTETTDDAGTVTLSGTGNIVGKVDYFYQVTVSGAYTLTTGSLWVRTTGTGLTISGTLTVNSGRYVFGGADITVQNGGTITGDGYVTVGAGEIDLQSGGTWELDLDGTRLNIVTAGTFDCNCTVDRNSGDQTITLPAGTTTFTGNVTWGGTDAAAYTIDMSANGSLVFQGSLTIQEGTSTTWTKGTGGISFTGANAATLTAPAAWGQTLEDITVNKTNTLTLGSNITTDSFTGTSGTVDLGGFTLTSAGAVAVNNPFNFAATQTTSSIAVQSGTLALNGANGAQLIIDDIDFAMSAGVTGAATYADVTNSTATGDADIDASDGTSNDLGGNTGWDFVAGAPTPVIDDPGAQTGMVDVPFSLQMTASESPTSWSAINLPTGLTIDNAGLISGTPTTAQVITASITATNAAGDSTPQDVEFTIQIRTDITATNPYGSDAIAFNWTVLPAGGQQFRRITTVQTSPQLIGSDWAAINQWNFSETSPIPGVETYQSTGFRITESGTYRLSAYLKFDSEKFDFQWVEGDVETGTFVWLPPLVENPGVEQTEVTMPTIVRVCQQGDKLVVGARAVADADFDVLNLLDSSWLAIERVG